MYAYMEHRCCNSSLNFSEVILIQAEVPRENKNKVPLFFSNLVTGRSVRPTRLHNFPVGFVPRPIFFPDTCIIRNEKDMSPNLLHHGVGAEGE